MKNLKKLKSIISSLEDKKDELETLLESVEAERDTNDKLEEEIGYIEYAINELDSAISSLGGIEQE